MVENPRAALGRHPRAAVDPGNVWYVSGSFGFWREPFGCGSVLPGGDSSFLPIVLPLALLISLLFTMGKLHRNNEFTAMRAAGIGLFRITRSIWMVGFLFSGLTLYLNAELVPKSVEQSQRIFDGYRFRYQAKSLGTEKVGNVASLAFDNQRERRMWFINRYNRLSERAYGVTLSELDSHRREKTRIIAREATFDKVKRVWDFKDGREIWFDPETGDVTRSQPFTEKRYSQFKDDPDLLLIFDRKPEDLSFFQLKRIVEHFSLEENPKVNRYAVRFYGLLADTLGSLIVIGIAIPFAVSGVRVAPAVGVSKSLGLFFAYYLLTSFATMLGANDTLDPMLAAWLPNLAMFGIACLLFMRVR